MRRHHVPLVALTLGASLLLGDIPVGAAVASSMPQTTKQTVLLKDVGPKTAAKRKKGKS